MSEMSKIKQEMLQTRQDQTRTIQPDCSADNAHRAAACLPACLLKITISQDMIKVLQDRKERKNNNCDETKGAAVVWPVTIGNNKIQKERMRKREKEDKVCQQM